MVMTFIDAEVNVTYARQRVAELRRMGEVRALEAERQAGSVQPLGLRRRVGVALVTIGQRIGGVASTTPMATQPVTGRLS